MFLSAYRFDGEPMMLTSAYDVLRATFSPEALHLQVCVVTDRGITVYDACPSRQQFEQFCRSTEFHAAVRAAGLPSPRIEPLGEVHHVTPATAPTR